MREFFPYTTYMNMKYWYLSTAVFCSLFIFVHSRNPCAAQDFGKGSVVCVCNVTYCDDLDPVKKPEKGFAIVFETTKSGDRFKETHLKFGDKNNQTVKTSQTITVDRSKKFQKIIGFGGAFTDATTLNVHALPQSLQDRLIKDLFSDNGIEYTLCRVPIGGCDFSTHPYTYDDGHKDDFELKYFQLQDEDYIKIPLMHLGMNVSSHDVKYFGSPWSAPAWMKTNNEINHGGYLIGQPGGPYYKAFANYFVKFLDAYKDNGVPIWGITVENEPKAGNDSTYSFNSLGFTPESERDFMKIDLGPTLEKAGYGVNKLALMIFDDQRDQLVRWTSTIEKDAEAAKYSTGIAYHWYDNTDANLGELDKAHDIAPNKYILNTEASCGHFPILGGWDNIERIAKDVIQNLNHWVTGWLGWNIALDMEGGPSWISGFGDAEIVVDAEKQQYYKQPAFYGMGHFSKFLVEDSIKVQFEEQIKLDKFMSTAFERPDGSVVVVVINWSEDSVGININDTNNVLSHVIKPHSLQTIIYTL